MLSIVVVGLLDVPATSACRIFVSLIVAFHYPLQCHPGRRSAMSIWKKLVHESPAMDPPPNTFRFRYIVITAAFLGTGLIVALTLDDLGVMLGVVGATGSTMVSYILPSAFYLQMHRLDDSVPRWTKLAASIQLLVGLVVMPLSLTFIFLKTRR